MYRDAVKIFRDNIFSKIDRTIRVKTVLFESNVSFDVLLCDDKYIELEQELQVQMPDGTFAGSYYVVGYIESIILNNQVVNNVWRISKGSEEQFKDGAVFRLPEAQFINGTRLVANKEWKINSVYDSRRGLPLVWLHETIRERFQNKDSAIERISSYKIFLLNRVDPTDTNSGMRAGAVRTMYGFLDCLIEVIDSKKNGLKRSGGFDVVSFSYFGVEDRQGIRKAILDEHLGGLEVTIDVDVYKQPCSC